MVLNNKRGLPVNIALIIAALWIVSCNSLKPITQNNQRLALAPSDVKKFDGDYELALADSSFPNLAYALTFTAKKEFANNNRRKKLKSGDYRVNLQSIDATRLKITVYHNEKVVKTKIIRGIVHDEYFHFTLTKLFPVKPFYLLLTVGRKQKNRIGLLQNGDLIMDFYDGGILFLGLMPTFGGDWDQYDLIFKRRNK